jgi:hypothetical protein
MSIPLASHYPPKYRNQPPKADLRQDITAFRLLVWTYADECVRAASDGEADLNGEKTTTVLGRLIDGDEGAGRGSINGLLIPHDDAVVVDGLVWAWLDQDWGKRAYYASYLEKRLAPPHPMSLEPERRVPRLRANGKPYVIYDHNRNRVGVLEDIVGHSAKQIAYADQMYCLFEGLLDVLQTIQLKKWRVKNRGLTGYAESLTSLRTV